MWNSKQRPLKKRQFLRGKLDQLSISSLITKGASSLAETSAYGIHQESPQKEIKTRAGIMQEQANLLERAEHCSLAAEAAAPLALCSLSTTGP